MSNKSALITFVATIAVALQPSHAFLSPHSRMGITPTYLNANLASELIMKELAENSNNDRKKKLTRPERKALERERKARRTNSKRKHNYADRAATLQSRDEASKGRYALHSRAVSSLTKDSSPDDVMQAIKRAQNLHDVHDIRVIKRFLLEEVGEDFAFGYKGSLLARLAVAAMHLNHDDIARQVIEERRLKHRSGMLPLESAAIIRGLLRLHNVTDALEILEDELSLPLEGTPLDLPESRERIKHRALSLGSVASRHFFEGEPSYAVRACKQLAGIGPIVREAGLTSEDVGMPWDRIVKGAANCESGRRGGTIKPCDGMGEVELPCNLIYSVLGAMTTFPSANDDRTYEILSNALVRRVLFITGAVDMAGCPPADRGEAAFIGRSNVGKSSLVNMITNRKSLAYTSKTPGKTQQFNFFAVNDKPGKEKEVRYGDDVEGEKDFDSFYIVDLPGFGFAKVPEYQRREWANFMAEYIQNRKSLKVLFHLIDGRHGPTAEDERIMKQVGQILPRGVSYVVALTKADKNMRGSKKNTGKVEPAIMQNLREQLKVNKLGNTPVILTSAETKLGRDDLWRYLSLAAES